MPAISIEVPPERREGLLRELLAYYGVKAEAIFYAVDHYLDGDEPVQSLLRHRQELAAIDALIDRLGWELDRSAPAISLSGDRDLISQACRGALANAVGDLNSALERAGGGADEVQTI